MSAPPARSCAACGRALAPGALYYRFTLVLEGEQDVLGGLAAPELAGTEEELATLLKQLENGTESAEELEAQVHWEREGAVCPACRAVVVRTLSAPPEPEASH